MAGPTPTLRAERAHLREGHALVAGMDEVGRGALAGPVTVGVVVVDLATRSAPVGLRDSKLLTPLARARLAPRVRRWAPAWAVGHAQAWEIDEIGIMRALRLAGRRAMAQLPVTPSLVLLDGNHDWYSPPQPTLFDVPLDAVEPAAQEWSGWDAVDPWADGPVVRTMIKADLRCAAVAAASVLAKTERDGLMLGHARTHPGYGWEVNKGYSAPAHAAALDRLGPCTQHRQTWSLPGMMDPDHHPGGTAELIPTAEIATEMLTEPAPRTEEPILR